MNILTRCQGAALVQLEKRLKEQLRPANSQQEQFYRSVCDLISPAIQVYVAHQHDTGSDTYEEASDVIKTTAQAFENLVRYIAKQHPTSVGPEANSSLEFFRSATRDAATADMLSTNLDMLCLACRGVPVDRRLLQNVLREFIYNSAHWLSTSLKYLKNGDGDAQDYAALQQAEMGRFFSGLVSSNVPNYWSTLDKLLSTLVENGELPRHVYETYRKVGHGGSEEIE